MRAILAWLLTLIGAAFAFTAGGYLVGILFYKLRAGVEILEWRGFAIHLVFGLIILATGLTMLRNSRKRAKKNV